MDDSSFVDGLATFSREHELNAIPTPAVATAALAAPKTDLREISPFMSVLLSR
jgi:hypothetical protein